MYVCSTRAFPAGVLPDPEAVARKLPATVELYSPLQFSIQEHALRRNVKRFRGGLALKAHRLLIHSTLGSRVTKKRKKATGV